MSVVSSAGELLSALLTSLVGFWPADALSAVKLEVKPL